MSEPDRTPGVLYLGRDVWVRLRLPRVAHRRRGLARIGSVGFASRRFAAVLAQPPSYRARVGGPQVVRPNSLAGATTTPPRWWQLGLAPVEERADWRRALSSAPIGSSSAPIGSSSAPIGSSSAPIGSSSAPIGSSSAPIGRADDGEPMPPRGLPRAARSAPHDQTWTPGGIVNGLVAQVAAVRRHTEVAAAGPMLTSHDRAKLAASDAARPRPEAESRPGTLARPAPAPTRGHDPPPIGQHRSRSGSSPTASTQDPASAPAPARTLVMEPTWRASRGRHMDALTIPTLTPNRTFTTSSQPHGIAARELVHRVRTPTEQPNRGFFAVVANLNRFASLTAPKKPLAVVLPDPSPASDQSKTNTGSAGVNSLSWTPGLSNKPELMAGRTRSPSARPARGFLSVAFGLERFAATTRGRDSTLDRLIGRGNKIHPASSAASAAVAPPVFAGRNDDSATTTGADETAAAGPVRPASATASRSTAITLAATRTLATSRKAGEPIRPAAQISAAMAAPAALIGTHRGTTNSLDTIGTDTGSDGAEADDVAVQSALEAAEKAAQQRLMTAVTISAPPIATRTARPLPRSTTGDLPIAAAARLTAKPEGMELTDAEKDAADKRLTMAVTIAALPAAGTGSRLLTSRAISTRSLVNRTPLPMPRSMTAIDVPPGTTSTAPSAFARLVGSVREAGDWVAQKDRDLYAAAAEKRKTITTDLGGAARSAREKTSRSLNRLASAFGIATEIQPGTATSTAGASRVSGTVLASGPGQSAPAAPPPSPLVTSRPRANADAALLPYLPAPPRIPPTQSSGQTRSGRGNSSGDRRAGREAGRSSLFGRLVPAPGGGLRRSLLDLTAGLFDRDRSAAAESKGAAVSPEVNVVPADPPSAEPSMFTDQVMFLELVDRVVERIESRVVDELERRGRRYNPGAF